MLFHNRTHAGQLLAAELKKKYGGERNAIILGLPRGGVVTAAEVARELKLPLDIVVPRKIGFPGNPEFAIGAISEEGERVLDENTVLGYGIEENYIDRTVREEMKEAARRLKTYRGKRPPLILTGKTAILVDDGVATGATMRAAILSAHKKGAKKVVVATPVIARDTLKKLQAETDDVVYLDAPVYFGAVGAFYQEFAQTTDEEVIALMQKHKDCVPARA